MAAGIYAPAMADPVQVLNVQMWANSYDTNIATSQGNIQFAGAIDYTVNFGAGPEDIPVWCDDLNNVVYLGSQAQYYTDDANFYLTNGTSLSVADAQSIAGLSYLGDINLGQADLDAEIQLAIWEIESAGLTVNNAGFQANVAFLIANASVYYGDMVGAGWLYTQLESPGCGQQDGTINYTNDCQIQGQIYAYPGPGGNGGNGGCGNSIIGCDVPEPGALGLMGSGLFASGLFGSGLLGWRRRKSSKADQA
jgi:hypothetical protein